MDEHDTKQINRLNGQSVFSALARFNYNATESQICDEFIESTGHAQHLVVEEVKRILQSAVNDGFIVKNGNNYTLPNVTHIDDSNCEEEDHEEGARSGCVTPEQQEEEVDGIAGSFGLFKVCQFDSDLIR